MEIRKYVEVNRRDLRLALRESLRPMQTFLDPEHGWLPYFGNNMAGEEFGNRLDTGLSVSHVPGRWLNALLSAEDVLGREEAALDEDVVNKLAYWAHRCVADSPVGLPPHIDLETLEMTKTVDLHNLRETMHALAALTRYRQDEKARALALRLIDTVDRYYDYDAGRFDAERWSAATGGREVAWDRRFPRSFGRYIGPLVKFWKATGEPAALRQALRLKDVCFRGTLNERGDYDPLVFGFHTHSTTSMISSLAILGDAVGDRRILERCRAFLENGLREIAADFGWCIEGYARQDDVGEINNTADILETCLILGKWGYPGYYARAERILRTHLLPAQLLDTHFIPEPEDPADPARYHLASRSRGAFGFPCPYGHEYSKDASWISFNWDIVGGGAEGLCEAIRAQWSRDGGLLSINLLFDADSELFSFRNPYDGDGTAALTVHAPLNALRVRIPGGCAGVKAENAAGFADGEWLYLSGFTQEVPIRLLYDFRETVTDSPFRGRFFTFRRLGEEVTGAVNGDKRLCFFPEIAQP